MKVFNGRVAAITGGASGLGEAIALNLASRGCHVALADVQASALEAVAETVRERGVNCTTHLVDVADRTQVERYAQEVQDRHGAVHMVFNNAGIALADYVDSHSYDDFERLMQINFWGVVYGTKAFLPLLKTRDEAHITNISSLFGLGSLPTQSAYNASKFAVRGFTEALKMELAATSVGVSSVHPGGIKTNIARNSIIAKDVPMSKASFVKRFDKLAITTADQAAAIIVKGISKNKRRIIVGKDAWIADKIIRWFPASYERILRLEKPLHARFKVSKK